MTAKYADFTNVFLKKIGQNAAKTNCYQCAYD